MLSLKIPGRKTKSEQESINPILLSPYSLPTSTGAYNSHLHLSCKYLEALSIAACYFLCQQRKNYIISYTDPRRSCQVSFGGCFSVAAEPKLTLNKGTEGKYQVHRNKFPNQLQNVTQTMGFFLYCTLGVYHQRSSGKTWSP